MGPSQALRKTFASYEVCHRTEGNERCHWIGIPLVMISLLGLLARLPLVPPLDFALLLWGVATVYYLVLDWKLGAPFSLVVFVLYAGSRELSLPVLWVLFGLGWFFQIFGHYYFEKRSPAFFTNLKQLLVGPFWLFSRLFHSYRLQK
ncbi:MAG: Mpo1-like protein [Bacteriovoracia bacterium]